MSKFVLIDKDGKKKGDDIEIITEEESVVFSKLYRMNTSMSSLYIADHTENYVEITISGKVLFDNMPISDFIYNWSEIKASSILSKEDKLSYKSGTNDIDEIYCIDLELSINATDRLHYGFSIKAIYKYGNSEITMSTDTPNIGTKEIEPIEDYGDRIISIGTGIETTGKIQTILIRLSEKYKINYFNESITTFGSFPVDISIVSVKTWEDDILDYSKIKKFIGLKSTLTILNDQYEVFIKSISNKRTSNQQNYAIYQIDGVLDV